MRLTLDFSTGETEVLDEEDWELNHPIFSSPLIQDIVECQDQEGSEQVNVQLPAFVEHSAMVAFVNFLFDLKAGNQQMGFGKYHNMTYKQVYVRHRDYWQWGKRQNDPSGGLKAFLDWVEFYRGGCKPESPDVMLPIAKYFQIDMCARCGTTGSPITTSNNLHPCQRAKWPRAPVVPDWEAVTQNVEDNLKLNVWKEAWEQVDKDRKESGKVVCGSDEALCSDCVLRYGCQRCRKFECEDCKQDQETPKVFEKWHEGLPDAPYEDDYGQRGLCDYRALNVTHCLKCRRRVCHACSKECMDCHRRACEFTCKEDLDTFCEEHGHVPDGYDGPLPDEYVCRECFYRQPHFCMCGQPSYDPQAPQSEDSADEDSEDGYNYGFDYYHGYGPVDAYSDSEDSSQASI